MSEPYVKDFDAWNVRKKEIEGQTLFPPIFHEREIWWCSLGLNIGSEQDGKPTLYERPVLVLKKFSTKLFLGIPLTTSSKIGNYYLPININGQNGNLILSQIRVMSSKRLNRFMVKLLGDVFKNVLREFCNMIQEEKDPP
jgi:mRNA-degrading endonuclease toxin of MazEF toxin-antitoxin module